MLASKKAGQSEVTGLLTPGCKGEGKEISLKRCVGVESRVTYLNDIKKIKLYVYVETTNDFSRRKC